MMIRHFGVTLLTMLSFGLLSSCGSLMEWKRHMAEESPEGEGAASGSYSARQLPAPTAWRSEALLVPSGALSAAKDRWPWAEGAQLQRRAQILQMGPDYRALQSLDTEGDTASEIRILREVMQQQRQPLVSRGD